MKKMYCLVVTDGYSRFSWVFFLATKDETSEINLKVKVIRCDNGTEFKNRVMNQFCEMKGIKREFSVARTLQQNGTEAVNTACYVQNRLLVIKPHNKTPYELFLGRKHAVSFMRPFGYPVTILNTIDHLGKFDGKADEFFFVGYSTNSKAFRVFNSRTRIVEENLHVQFSDNTPNIAGSRPNGLFDIDALTKSMNYKPVVVGNQSNGNAGTKACNDAGKARMETISEKDYILLPIWPADPLFSQDLKSSLNAGFKLLGEEEKKDAEDPGNKSGNPTEVTDSKAPSTEKPRINQEKDDNINSTNNINTASDGNNINNVNVVSSTISWLINDDEDVGAEADMDNLDAFMLVSPILTTRIHKDHLVNQIIGDLNSAPQTRRMTKNLKEHEEPKKVIQALKDPSWIEAMQEELLQFKLQHVWTLIDLPNGKRAIGTKWVYKNKKDERAIRLFLAYASFKYFVVYQMDVKSAFLYEKIKEEVYVCQPPGFEETYLLDNGFQRGKIDKTLFIRRVKSDILTANEAKGGWDFYQSSQHSCLLHPSRLPTLSVYTDLLSQEGILRTDKELSDGAHDPNYVPEPMYPEYIPLEDEHVFPAEEQPLPPVVSPTAESPGYVVESDP
ncbi:ribonuclease H-like domain-containing protein [Tanacetum coccineum]|uniref:Ribonuclease H-like domain-containing protein n=1 Tax=Tanacetum coccineum TaxID=301880 RepID=A0ABQ5BV12_9ASTR